MRPAIGRLCPVLGHRWCSQGPRRARVLRPAHCGSIEHDRLDQRQPVGRRCKGKDDRAAGRRPQGDGRSARCPRRSRICPRRAIHTFNALPAASPMETERTGGGPAWVFGQARGHGEDGCVAPRRYRDRVERGVRRRWPPGLVAKQRIDARALRALPARCWRQAPTDDARPPDPAKCKDVLAGARSLWRGARTTAASAGKRAAREPVVGPAVR